MSREIKFRAWQTHHKEMYQPFVGYIEFPDIVVGFDDGDLRLEGEKNVILMQTTGLKDKNGKEIYEGDVLKIETKEVSSFRGYIFYDDKKSGFQFYDLVDKQSYTIFNIDKESFEVIGNIWQNPELLTPAKG